MSKSAIVEVFFHEGARKEPPFGERYRPHFIPDGSDDYLGIEFLNLSKVSFGEHTLSKVRFPYDGVDYSALSPNKHFVIKEGPHIVGEGVVIYNYANTDISLSHDEALILLNLLDRISQDESLFPDIAERQVLWCIEGQLDKLLVEPFTVEAI